ncbi:unnamed protein product [Calicophoron daubneyi]|uniref:Uncharacterized protein n=1 Tax=Calicophoron daubneyi TaxID=300641 RepID=A0AAV2TMC2_CALDB
MFVHLHAQYTVFTPTAGCCLLHSREQSYLRLPPIQKKSGTIDLQTLSKLILSYGFKRHPSAPCVFTLTQFRLPPSLPEYSRSYYFFETRSPFLSSATKFTCFPLIARVRTCDHYCFYRSFRCRFRFISPTIHLHSPPIVFSCFVLLSFCVPTQLFSAYAL